MCFAADSDNSYIDPPYDLSRHLWKPFGQQLVFTYKNILVASSHHTSSSGALLSIDSPFVITGTSRFRA